MSEIKVNSIKGVGASAAAITVNNTDGTCTLASGSKLNNCTTDGTTNLTIADGNLVVGTAGHGIDFSATSGSGTSELFDDYEEGSFTPTTSGFTNTHNPDGRYVKIGNHVFLSLVFTRSGSTNFTMAGGDNGVVITNLPFACGLYAGVGQVIVPQLNYTGSTNGNGATLLVEPGQAKIYVSGAGFTTPRCNMSVFYKV